MRFEWDSNKAKKNIFKHGVHFSDVEDVFYDERAITRHDFCSREERFVILGMDGFGRILVVVYTYRNNSIRIISSRMATEKERIQYFME